MALESSPLLSSYDPARWGTVIPLVVASETIELPLADARRLLDELRRLTLLPRAGEPVAHGVVAASVHLEQLLGFGSQEAQEQSVPLLELEATGLLAALEAIETDDRLSEPLAELRLALSRLISS